MIERWTAALTAAAITMGAAGCSEAYSSYLEAPTTQSQTTEEPEVHYSGSEDAPGPFTRGSYEAQTWDAQDPSPEAPAESATQEPMSTTTTEPTIPAPATTTPKKSITYYTSKIQPTFTQKKTSHAQAQAQAKTKT